MLKWSVNNIPEIVKAETDEEVNKSTVFRVEQGIDKELELVNRRTKARKWKKLAFFSCRIRMKKTSRGIFKQGHGLVHHFELLHAGDSWLYVICKPNHDVFLRHWWDC